MLSISNRRAAWYDHCVSMTESPSFPGLGTPRHSVAVRITHWIHTLSFVGLVVSGVAILLAHPRLYWGETGSVGTPSLLDLPLPFVLTGQSGWGRSLHFQTAWVAVLNGLVYLATRRSDSSAYAPLQRLAYQGVTFFLFPLAIWTGLAMSPAIVSVFPLVVTIFGGQQSARTLHFLVAVLLAAFLLAHVIMVWRAGFTRLMRGMIFGGTRG